ncbi:hypothetical protein EDC61_10453 [Sulfuritortus calidifontis]|uniref:Uncharacterized protein n=1 Tax=Sulfuritortus calidifontis TaxID=1914471 RepID=A0A4R3JWL0_9PROT|nr:hypothetical protein [Sulfuritortus calidifontis]TCS72643.1 hypothetical protein EDC61_10453 [Sulfuritortus calidifontis]
MRLRHELAINTVGQLIKGSEKNLGGRAVRVGVALPPAPRTQIRLTEEGFQAGEFSGVADGVAVDKPGGPTGRINTFYTCPSVDNLGCQRMSGGCIRLAGELLNERLQMATTVPQHGLVQVMNIAKTLQVRQRSDRIGFWQPVVGDGIGLVYLKPNVSCGAGTAVSSGEGARLFNNVAVGVRLAGRGITGGNASHPCISKR